jgi:hypothetical protein
MTPGQGQGPDSPLDYVRAETYLRLLAEAEPRRRGAALPRPDPLAAIGVPSPLRGPVRLAMPLSERAVTALQPRQQHPGHPPAGTYLAAPMGVVLPAAPEGSLRDTYVVSLVIVPDRAVLTAAGRSGEVTATVPLDWREPL